MRLLDQDLLSLFVDIGVVDLGFRLGFSGLQLLHRPSGGLVSIGLVPSAHPLSQKLGRALTTFKGLSSITGDEFPEAFLPWRACSVESLNAILEVPIEAFH